MIYSRCVTFCGGCNLLHDCVSPVPLRFQWAVRADQPVRRARDPHAADRAVPRLIRRSAAHGSVHAVGYACCLGAQRTGLAATRRPQAGAPGACSGHQRRLILPSGRGMRAGRPPSRQLPSTHALAAGVRVRQLFVAGYPVGRSQLPNTYSRHLRRTAR